MAARTSRFAFFDSGLGRRLAGLAAANERVAYGVLGFVGISLLWEVASGTGLIRRSLLSAPSLIWKAAVTDFGSGAIWPHIATSLNEFGLGFLLALVIGIPLGLLIGMFRRVDYFASVLLSGIYATPKVALVPLIILVAGIGLEAKLIVVFLLTIFAVVVSTVSGVHSVAQRHLDLTRSFGASRWLVFRSVVLPSTFPFILTGVRIGAGRALVGVVTAEFLSANEGVGYYISLYGTFLDTSRVMLGIVLLGVFGVAIGEIVRLIEKRFEVWRPEIS
ncbi:MAG TPA: ABC transporter permease [Candidatus Saccharimonadales bacterium]|nr:ABC transporter permease [Candidatus Saccharimonadales bacterium]